MAFPFFASCTASSISAAGTMHTGQPGPAMTSTFSGRRLRSPKCVMVHSWVPHTWHIFTLCFLGVTSLIFSAIFWANSGFLNFRFWAIISPYSPAAKTSFHRLRVSKASSSSKTWMA